MRKGFSALVLSAAVFASSPAAAATMLQFDLSGAAQASFQLPSEPVPSGTRTFTFPIFSDSFYLENVQVTYNGVDQLAELAFYSDIDWLGGFDLNVGGGAPEIGAIGSYLFSGPTSDPVFRTGTFDLYEFNNFNQTYSLTISEASVGAVPEPATWILMIMGFGLVGATIRRKQRNVRPVIA